MPSTCLSYNDPIGAAAQISLGQSSRVSCRWIVGRGVDLVFISGSALAGYAYLALNLLLQVPMTYLWWIWSIGFDGTHIFATASRTYFDREARRSRRALLFGSLAVFFSIGPVMVLVGLKPLLGLLVGFWAYYHVIKQHYGFMVLYKVKNRETAGRLDSALDRVLLSTMLVFPPFHRFFIHHPGELGIPQGAALDRAAPWAEPVLWSFVIATVLVYIARQVKRTRGGQSVNLPKYLLFAGIFPLHWLVFAKMSWLAAVPTVTIVHNLQYHALIWFHNRNRYAAAGAVERNGRIPQAVARSLLAYAVLALLFSVAYRLPGFELGRAFDLAFGFFCGFGFTHYYLDSKIWRVRQDPGLRDALRM